LEVRRHRLRHFAKTQNSGGDRNRNCCDAGAPVVFVFRNNASRSWTAGPGPIRQR
jgi:hypothetical protein